MSKLPLDKIWEVKLLQEEYNKTMFELQLLVDKSFQLESKLLDKFAEEKGINLILGTRKIEGKEVTDNEFYKIYQEWKKRK